MFKTTVPNLFCIKKSVGLWTNNTAEEVLFHFRPTFLRLEFVPYKFEHGPKPGLDAALLVKTILVHGCVSCYFLLFVL